MMAKEDNREKNDAWVESLKPIIGISKRYGARIKSHILKALAAGPPAWAQKLLKQSISNQVYRCNRSGPTKRAVLLVLSKFLGPELELPRPNQKRNYIGNKSIPNKGKSWEDPVSVTERCQHVLQKLRSMDKFQKLLDLIRCICPGPHNNGGMSSVTAPSKTSAIDIGLIDTRVTSGVYGSSPQLFLADLQKVWTNIIGVGTEMIFLAKSLAEIVESEYNSEISSIFEKNHNADKIIDDPQKERHCEGLDLSSTKHQLTGDNAVIAPEKERYQWGNLNLPEMLEVPWGEKTCDQETTEVEPKIRDASTVVPNVPTNPGEGASCKVCGVAAKEDDGVSCNSCKATYHMHCLSPFLTNVPDSQWLCESCLCTICRIDADDDLVLLCDSCDRGYHTYCLQPPLASIPAGHWICNTCIQNRKTFRNVCKHIKVDKQNLREACKFNEHLSLQGICYVCGIDEDRSNLILCFDCGEVYHRYCLIPPILNHVNSDWRCPECA